jgi:hypothetical protein
MRVPVRAGGGHGVEAGVAANAVPVLHGSIFGFELGLGLIPDGLQGLSSEPDP